MHAERTLSLSAFITIACAATLLSACSDSSINPFGADDKKAVEGNRVTIISMQNALEANESMANVDVEAPEASTIDVWPQEGGSPAHFIGNIALSLNLTSNNSTDAGNGNAWQGSLIAAPVATSTHVFSMDGHGIVSASPLDALSSTIWSKQVGKEPNLALNGGGLATEDETVFAALANGNVTALATKNGAARWSITLDMPIRSAPLITPESLIVITTGSQLYALDKHTGQTLWRHRGIQETASLLGTVTPAYANNTVVAVYPSGEVYALNASDGKPLWSDSLLLPERTSALGTFSGVGGMPVIVDDVAYSVSSNGLLIANHLKTGMRLWDISLASTNTPWIAGDFLYALSTQGKLIAANRLDGRIKWIIDLPDYDASDDDAPALKGPFMVGGSLLVMRGDGEWQLFDPKTGALTKENDITSGSLSAPAFTKTSVLVANHNATLYSIH